VVHWQKEINDGQQNEGDPYHDKEIVEIDFTKDCHYENRWGQEVWENFVPRHWFNLGLSCLSCLLLLVF
jgi:hypothetical protein